MNNLHSLILVVLAAAALIVVAPIVKAGTEGGLEATSSSAYTATQKFGRGLAGMTLGFLEIPGNTIKKRRTKARSEFPSALPMG